MFEDDEVNRLPRADMKFRRSPVVENCNTAKLLCYIEADVHFPPKSCDNVLVSDPNV